MNQISRCTPTNIHKPVTYNKRETNHFPFRSMNSTSITHIFPPMRRDWGLNWPDTEKPDSVTKLSPDRVSPLWTTWSGSKTIVSDRYLIAIVVLGNLGVFRSLLVGTAVRIIVMFSVTLINRRLEAARGWSQNLHFKLLTMKEGRIGRG